MRVEAKGKDPSSREENETKLGEDITLIGFSLEPSEMAVVRKIIRNRVKKIKEQIKYQSIKITLKKTKKAKSFLHEIVVDVVTNKRILTASITDRNLYAAISEALNKIKNQAEHKK